MGSAVWTVAVLPGWAGLTRVSRHPSEPSPGRFRGSRLYSLTFWRLAGDWPPQHGLPSLRVTSRLTYTTGRALREAREASRGLGLEPAPSLGPHCVGQSQSQVHPGFHVLKP